ncbi:MAG: SIR2 family protein [Balneola sp.]|jgi:hypothetical protein|nr:SIR2 family protein [Balneola sp.]MBE77628.1 SIR2 family protein [Balneola sp.]|tara:strand:- start:5716 stop:7491 length:1776 start_codon:yes stop_codon:yes gene_type:complete
MEQDKFIQFYIKNAKQIGWFLGAGASRSANMPSATDIIWDLKRQYYCLKEKRDITDNDLSNKSVKETIQNYFNSTGAPELWSENEYSYYFNLVLGNDKEMHQSYLQEKLHESNISLTSGSKILASLMGQNLARIVYTTNFDHVLENAFSFINERSLHAFNLEGSHAVLNALVNEEYPIYAKMHGDFKYTSLKNLPDQLIENDQEIEKSFISACTRFGMVVCGYSGRDQNVMNAFNKVLEETNPFPKGIYWTKPINGNLFSGVETFLEKAKKKGVNAQIVEIETFDSLLSRIWKIVENKPSEHHRKIRKSISSKPNISKFDNGNSYPLIRTNLFPIKSLPNQSDLITTNIKISVSDFSRRLREKSSGAILTHINENEFLAWGSKEDYFKIIPEKEIASIKKEKLDNYLNDLSKNSLIKSFITRALIYSLLNNKPLVLKRRFGDYYAVISKKSDGFEGIESILRNSLKSYNFEQRKHIPPKHIVKRIARGIFYMESIELSLEYFDEMCWLAIRPDVWIEPSSKRKDVTDFIRNMKKNRYNSVQNSLIDAWKKVLLGNNDTVILKSFNDEEEISCNPEFEIVTTTAYSKRIKNA